MEALLIALFFILGTIMGSFFGVVGSRLPKNESIVSPGSHCGYCSTLLKWYELIPIFSYVLQKGKCRHCHKSLSIFYPMIELMSGLLFSVSYFLFQFSPELLIALIIASFLMIVMVSDINYFIIPDEVTLFFSILMLGLKFVMYGYSEFFWSILSGALLFSVMYVIMVIGNKIFHKETLGGADIKLMFFVGLVLTPSLGILTIFLSSCLALPISLLFLFKTKDSIIPYGPFILIALYLIYCFV